MDKANAAGGGYQGLLEHFYTLYHKLFYPDIVLISSQGNRLYVNEKDIGVAKPLICGGIFDRKETEVIAGLIRPGMVVVDVGANVGYFTLLAAKLAGKKGRVYAFEPEPGNYRLLARNIRINGYTNVVSFNKAMSDKAGKLTLFVDRVNFGAHSLSEKNLIQKAGAVEVDATTLDDFYRNIAKGRIDLIKMDTQGAEGLIFEGADQALRAPGLSMIVEFWPWGLRSVGTDPVRLLEKLQSYGFSMTVIDEKSQSLKSMSFDDLVRDCDNADGGWGYYNLLLVKS